MKTFTVWRSLLWTLTAGCFLALSAAGQTHVYPTNTPSPGDQDAIQAAINSLGSGGGTVVLHGTFNLGPDDGVGIVQSNVTLMGANDATIIGGGKQNVAAGVWYVISVENVGAQIKNLTLKDFKMAGILVRTLSTNPADNPVVIKSNTIATSNVYMNSFSFGIYVRATGCPVKILNNHVASARMVLYARLNTGDITVSGNTLTGGYYGMSFMANSRDVTVSGNTLTGSMEGAYIVQTGGRCIITNNTVYGSPTGQGIQVGGNPGDSLVLISGNTIRGTMDGIVFHDLGLTNHTLAVKVSNNIVEPAFTCPPGYFSDGAVGWSNNCPLTIVNNTVRVIADKPGDNPTCQSFGVLLYAWNAKNGLDQDNPPVLVKNNRFEIRYPFPEQPNWSLRTCGIMLGIGSMGINNVTVHSNKISGTTTQGVYVNSYCRNNLIEGNDLSGLGTWSTQMTLLGRETVVKNNILGFANRIPGFSYGVELASLQPDATMPMPYATENCVLFENDYRHTGLLGWSDETNGCIAIHSYADLGGLGTEVKNNLVFEIGRFPRGTGGAQEQVYELKTSSGLVHDNRIVSFPGKCLRYPGIGWRLKAFRGHSADMLAVLEEAMGKKEQGCGFEEESLQKMEVSSPSSSPDFTPSVLPAAPEILGNYPNPFNPSTSIKYALPLISYVRIEVYNTLGQMVTCLVDGVQLAGYHEVRFDASGLASGMYVCRLVAGSSVQTGKLLLMK
jgi:parallel beta-helix repeat protein